VSSLGVGTVDIKLITGPDNLESVNTRERGASWQINEKEIGAVWTPIFEAPFAPWRYHGVALAKGARVWTGAGVRWTTVTSGDQAHDLGKLSVPCLLSQLSR